MMHTPSVAETVPNAALGQGWQANRDERDVGSAAA